MSALLTVDLIAVRENYRLLAKRASVPLLPMVKADAYGLGAVEVARALEPEQPVALGVATVREGEELRAAGLSRPIVVFTPTLPAEFGRAYAADLILCLAEPADVTRWTQLGGRWQLQIDTGMSRAGVDWRDADTIRQLLSSDVPPEGVFTHFHSADRDTPSVAEQEARFEQVVSALPTRPAMVHAENSATMLQRTGSRYSCARPGIALFGVSVGPARWSPRPVVTLAAPIVSLRQIQDGDTVSYAAEWRATGARRIATVALGYADGYPRGAGNRATAVINDQRVPVIGHVTMDMTMCDVTDARCDIGDSAILIGAQPELHIGAIAAHAGRSPYEVLTGLRSRVARHYLHTDADALGVAA
jgi:alanine racemase